MNERARADLIVTGISELVTCAGPAPARGPDQSRVAVIRDGAFAAKAGTIMWVGAERELEAAVERLPGARTYDAGGRAVLPGIVDAHTHLVWEGDRADEFERRLAGASYSEIAAAGGGILRTVEATRAATEDRLAELAGARMDALSRHGATAVEVKSGYGLTAADERKLLGAARRAAAERRLEIVTTFMGAHTYPAEARGSAAARGRYLDELCAEMIPAVAADGLATFVDVFVDEHAFDVAAAERVLRAAADAGLGTKVHADQLADEGGASLAASMGSASADHLEHASENGLRALADAGSVAVLIPGASLFLRMERHADARRMIAIGLPVALATDLNPGTCPCASPPLVIQLGCLLSGLTIDEAIVAATLNAAAACGIADRAGSIEPGKRCDFVVLDAPDRRRLVYDLGSAPIHAVWALGHPVT